MSEHQPQLPSGQEQAAMLTMDQVREQEAQAYAQGGEEAYVNAVRPRMDHAAAYAQQGASREVAVRDNNTDHYTGSTGNELAIPDRTPVKSTANSGSSRYGTSLVPSSKNNMPATRATSVEVGDEIIDAEIIEEDPKVPAVVAPAAELPVIDAESWEDPKPSVSKKNQSVSTDLVPATDKPGTELVPATSTPGGIGDPLSRARYPHSPTRKPRDPAVRTATGSTSIEDAREKGIAELQTKAEAALERWTRLSADRSGRIFRGNKKGVQEAYEEYLDIQGSFIDAKVTETTNTLRAAGFSDAYINGNVDSLRTDLKVAAAFNAAQKRTDIRKEMSQEYADAHPRTAKFVQWWAKQGGKGNWKGKIKKAAVLGLVGGTVGVGLAFVAPAAIGAGAGAAAALAGTRGVARGLAGAAIESRAPLVDNKVADAQHERHQADIATAAAQTGASLEDLTGHINTRTNEDIRRNRTRVGTAIGVGALSGVLGGAAANFIGDRIGDWFGGNAEPHAVATIPQTNPNATQSTMPLPKPPVFEPVTMKVNPGDGIQKVMDAYANKHHDVDLSGQEMHDMFLEGRAEDLTDKANVGDSFSGAKPMNVGGGVGFPAPGETTLSAETVEFMNKELTQKVIEDYIAEKHLDVDLSDKALEAMIDKAYADGIIQAGEVASRAQMDALLAELKS